MTEIEAIRELEWAKNRLMQCSHMDNNRMKSFNMAIKALEKIEKIKFIINEKHYYEAEECDYGNYYNCENALMIKDIEEIINSSET